MNADESREQVALRRCDEQIRWYDRYSKREWRLFTLFQSAAIALAAATPVLILWSSVPKAVQALPAALASIAAGTRGNLPLAPEQDPLRVHRRSAQERAHPLRDPNAASLSSRGHE